MNKNLVDIYRLVLKNKWAVREMPASWDRFHDAVSRAQGPEKIYDLEKPKYIEIAEQYGTGV